MYYGFLINNTCVYECMYVIMYVSIFTRLHINDDHYTYYAYTSVGIRGFGRYLVIYMYYLYMAAVLREDHNVLRFTIAYITFQ
jgi:hypothetical protein